ncbi:U1 small nuclear ribonucleoprotein component SNU71 [Candida albicans Ca529L]|nr:U1 small nuclear ribonucleoprotein component SNU71 [Candida albicans P94015]KGQ96861.1 U1 small nuclear ribonucleoprotein component SNU71 [Candida albicans P37005]KGR22242.1 U1 small nuclear ribonucleoprotein component SNU71 [Candida albicans P37037]KGT71186.1 U1 small nuclear ribonucleoprotein component SNU71 [Candida albicans 12C]KHC59313.1 U1 small nuclear ribonucleoprotein component SNU71 [Candida albicans P37039]RLP62881.1 U1 small nuclear ribonucleoprotein component SNU71 [Candida alb
MTAGDNSIEYVNPYSLSQTINSDLISILDPNGSTTSIIKPQLNYQIPIFKSIDVSNLIDLNNTKIQTQTNETRINKAKDSSDDHQNNPSSKDYDTSGENIVGGIDDIVEDIKLYVSIDKLKPENFQNQLTTIIINQFPTNLKSNLIEQLLKMLMNLKKFVWSFINHELIDLKLIFIKFDQLKDLKWFLLTYCDHISQLIPNVTIITNDKVNEYLNNNKDSSLAKVEPSKITDNLKAKINLIINNPINYTKGKKNSGTEDLDQVLDSYSNYKVDNNDLIDIPNNMKENIIKDIIRFRSRMLLIEKEQRKKEIEMERIKTKNKLKELFEGIKENSTDSTTRKATNKAAVGVTISPKVSHRDEYEDMNDKEYEEFIAVEERNKLNDQYNKKLKSFQNNQHAEYIKLTNKLKSLQNYESDLIDNKLKYIDNLKNYQTNGLAHLYTHNYSDYLRMRSQKRSLEETKDAEDVKQELEEIKKNGGQVASTNTNTNTKPSTYSSGVSELATTSVETPKSTTTTTNDTTDEPVAKKSKLAKEIIIIDLPPTVKQSLQEKIVELVENSLGIKDEFLIQVINENLEASNLDNKQELIDELVQVLDEDAESLVNELWDYIETMV